MLRLTELRLPLDHPADALRPAIVARLLLADGALHGVTVWRRGVDARRKSAVVLSYTVDCEVDDEAGVLARLVGDAQVRPTPDTTYRHVFVEPPPPLHDATARLPDGTADTAGATGDPRHPAARRRPVVVGFGPCGIFCALLLAQMGLRPIVLERGRAVRERTQDTWGLWRRRVLDPESNVQFGEGGAGTFSDGKLWSQISDPRHLTRKVIAEFIAAGSPEEIAWVAKPHIGTFRLVGVVERMRAEIERLGGSVRFGARVVDLHIDGGAVRGVTLHSGEQIDARHVVLALGHSARDTFAMLHARGVAMVPKPFAVGFRIEHPQGLIDRARWGANAGHPILGAADYKLVHHAANGRAVYTFCMCPGGTVVAATSEVGRVVTNGMSQYSRNERNANAGIVVGITPDDYRQGGAAAPGTPVHPLDGIAFQRALESQAYVLAGADYNAPGQRVGDFLRGVASRQFGDVLPSYKPGVTPCDLASVLPDYAIDAIRAALPAFDRQIKGYAMPDAVLTGVETRTSSPLRIPRGADGHSVNVRGLFPAGEGAGYAGGIMSAGVDGIEVAEAVARAMALALPA